MKPACFLGGYRYYSHYVEKLPTVNVQTVETPRLSCRLKRSTPTSKCLCWQYHIAVQEATGGNRARAPCAFPEAQDTSIPAADTRSNWAGHRRPHPRSTRRGTPCNGQPPPGFPPVSLGFEPRRRPKSNQPSPLSLRAEPASRLDSLLSPTEGRGCAAQEDPHLLPPTPPHTHTLLPFCPGRPPEPRSPKLSPQALAPHSVCRETRRDEAAKAAATERQSHRRESLNSTAVHRPTTPPPWARRTGRRSGGPPRPCGA